MLGQKLNFRNALADIYHSYYSDTDVSDLSEFTQSKILFFTDFQKRKKMISCRIENITTIPKQSYHRAYTLYQIDILTQQLYFTTQKRYSDFEKLNKRIKKFKSLQLVFPKKTYFHSGTQISVTSQRINMLNQFIQSILKLTDDFSDIKFMFFQFIGLWDKYVDKGVDINNTDYQYFLANTENVYIQILKLNENPKIISSILQRIRKLIFDYKIKLSLQTSRQLFFGLDNDKKGLLAFAFTIQNQYVAIQCLQLINDLLDPQLNKSAELFLKTLQNSTIKRLIVQQARLFDNLNFKILYYEVLKKYQSKPSQKQLRNIFGSNKQNQKQYLFWLKGKKPHAQSNIICASTAPREIFDKIECKKSFQKVKIKIQCHSFHQEQLLLNQKRTCFGNDNRGLLFDGDNYIGFKMKFPNSQKETVDNIDRKKWQVFQEQARSKYTDVITKTLNFKQQRRFKFNQQHEQQNAKITLEPIHTDHFDNCFFQFSQVISKNEQIEVIQIIYFCHNNSQQMKEFLKEKLIAFWTQKINQ